MLGALCVISKEDWSCPDPDWAFFPCGALPGGPLGAKTLLQGEGERLAGSWGSWQASPQAGRVRLAGLKPVPGGAQAAPPGPASSQLFCFQALTALGPHSSTPEVGGPSLRKQGGIPPHPLAAGIQNQAVDGAPGPGSCLGL